MKPEVALVNMPFSGIDRPSLGLSLLKAALAKRNIPCDVHYLNLQFAKKIGFELYKSMDFLPVSDLTGEWIFSSALWGTDQGRDREYVEQVLKGGSPHHKGGGFTVEGPAKPDWAKTSPKFPLMVKRALACRSQVETFLENCLKSFDWKQYRLVGFTSMFQQQLASLALASRLKQRFPNLLIAFGGSNCEGRMGAALFKAFPFIDVLCSGEGDIAFPEFVEQFFRGTVSATNTRLLVRELLMKTPSPKLQVVVEEPLAPRVEDMDSLPYPDFDDFFSECETLKVPCEESFRILIETSRGCWWGETSHCTFCGLNGSTMVFRRKSPQRVLKEIVWLVTRYGKHTRYFAATDNIIPLEYFSTVFPEIEKLDLNIQLFYETKSNLKKEQIYLCARAGLTAIQPGIESLSTVVLQCMGKGVTALQNIQLLKWCRQYGVSAFWHCLVGFPGESQQAYAEQADLIDSICHLQPPYSGGLGIVRYDRFSPHFTRPGEFGISNLRPYPSYHYVYPGISDDVLKDIAYFFVGDFAGREKIEEYSALLREAIGQWFTHQDEYALFSFCLHEQLLVCDFRPNTETPFVVLTGEQQALYEECDSICTKARLLKRLSEIRGTPVTEASLDAVLQPLLEPKLLLEEEGKYLSLAIPLGYQYAPGEQALESVLEIIESELEMRSSPVGATLGVSKLQ